MPKQKNIILKNRFPAKRDVALVFAASIFFVQIWSVYSLLRAVPAWMLSMSLWELTGTIAYPLAFTLVESGFVWLGMLIAAVILPEKILREKFVAKSALIIFLAMGWAIVAHFYGQAWRLWDKLGLLLWLGTLLTAIGIGVFSVQRFEKLARVINSLTERLSILAWIYLALDLLSVLVIILRNMG